MEMERFSLQEMKLLKEGSLVEYMAFLDFPVLASVSRHQKAFSRFLSTFPL